MKKIARRNFIQLSAAAAAGAIVAPTGKARADEMPKLAEDDPTAVAMKYTHDASTVESVSDQTCANCALIQGNDGDEWRPCPIFPGKSVAAAGWCSVWAPKG